MIIGLVIVTEPLWMVGLSSAGVLAYYAIGHISALAQPVTRRVVWRAVPITGLIGCAVLVVSLPWQSLIAAAVSLLLGTLWFLARKQAAQN
jgi:APA family basic amino acid/polyamine antiporter